MKTILIFVLVAPISACAAQSDAPRSKTQAISSQTPVVAVANVGNSAHDLSPTISGGFLNDKAKAFPQPEYPPKAKSMKASGTVDVHILVNEDGRVVFAAPTSGPPLLRSAAKQAALQAEFEPLILGGQKRKISGILRYKFEL